MLKTELHHKDQMIMMMEIGYAKKSQVIEDLKTQIIQDQHKQRLREETNEKESGYETGQDVG